MDIYSKEGTKIVFANPEGGYPGEGKYAQLYIKVGGIYTVEKIIVESYHTHVYIKEVPGRSFNSVLFLNYTEYKRLMRRR